METTHEDTLLTTREAASLLGRHTSTLTKHTQTGLIDAVEPPVRGRESRYRLADVLILADLLGIEVSR